MILISKIPYYSKEEKFVIKIIRKTFKIHNYYTQRIRKFLFHIK